MRTNLATEQESPNQESRKAGKVALIQRIEWIVAIALSVLVLFLLLVRASHAGALWRDEAESVQSARMPFGEMVRHIQFTSFPIVFPLCLRGYTTLFGSGDPSLRCFGLAVGILMLAAAWLISAGLSRQPPLLFPAIVGLNANFLIVGASLRGYGLGSALVLAAFGFTVMMLRSRTRRSSALTFVVCLISMQSLFFNGPLIAAIVIAVGSVLLIRGEFKWMWRLIGIATVCGLSYAGYFLQFYFQGSSWAKIQQAPFSFELLWQKFVAAWGETSTNIPTLWLVVVLASLLGAVWRLAAGVHVQSQRRDLVLFAVFLVPTAAIASFLFLKALPRAPEERYLLALTCLLVASADLILVDLCSLYWIRIARLSLVIFAIATVPFVIWPKILQAESNVEIVSKTIEENSNAGDLIVVSPWSYGVSFNWYYHGPTRWMTVPELPDHRTHRYDLLREKMMSAAPLEDVKREIATTLESGKRVWFVGQAEVPSAGNPPMRLTVAPDPAFGWQGAAYRTAWSREIGVFLQAHLQQVNAIVRPASSVSDRENITLYRIEGWKH